MSGIWVFQRPLEELPAELLNNFARGSEASFKEALDDLFHALGGRLGIKLLLTRLGIFDELLQVNEEDL